MWHRSTTEAVLRMLRGQPIGALPPLVTKGTPFQQKVWAAMRKIPLGSYLTYGDLAIAAGSPTAVRAVGTACGLNPIPLLVPCHRVLASGAKLGGFSSGLAWKRLLLAREKIGYREEKVEKRVRTGISKPQPSQRKVRIR